MHAQPPAPGSPGLSSVRQDDDIPEHSAEWYMRETARSSARTAQAAQFIAWIVGIAVALTVIFGIIEGITLAHIASQVNQVSTNGLP